MQDNFGTAGMNIFSEKNILQNDCVRAQIPDFYKRFEKTLRFLFADQRVHRHIYFYAAQMCGTKNFAKSFFSEILRTGAGGKAAESEIDRVCARADCRFRTGRVPRGRQNFAPPYYVRRNYFVRHSFQPGGVFYCV